MSVNTNNAKLLNLRRADATSNSSNGYIIKRAKNVAITNSSFTTLYTIAKTPGTDWVAGFIDIALCGGTNNGGVATAAGARWSRWSLNQAGGGFSATEVATSTSGTAPDITVAISSNSFLIQGKGSTAVAPGGNTFEGSIFIELYAARGLSSGSAWAIS